MAAPRIRVSMMVRISRGMGSVPIRTVAASVAFALAACTTQPPAGTAAAPTLLPKSAASAPAAAGSRAATGFSADLAALADREAAFEYAWHVVNDRFYDPAFNGVDWEAVRLRYLPQLERVESDAGFYSLLGRMVGELRDSHTRVYNARDYRNRIESVMSTVGIRVAEVDGEVAVVEVIPDTSAAAAGMRRGMVVKSINGESALERLRRLEADAPKDASPERRQRTTYSRMIAGGANGTLVLEVRGDPGRPAQRYELQRTEHETPVVVSSRILDGNIGLIAFNRFRPDTAADFARALARVADTDGIILDLRGNPGGNIGAMMSIAQNFFPDTRHVLTRRTRMIAAADAEPYSQPRISPEVRINANGRAYTRPLAVLIDGHSASSSELLATMLREQRGAYVIGRPSCGCVVAVRGSGYRLAGGGALYVAETGFVTPRGNRMEGMGIRPDAQVALTLADLNGRVDRDAVVARDWILRQTHRTAEEH